jgi:hypothetical protein
MMLKDRHKKFLWWGKDGVPIRGAVTNVMFALPTYSYARRDVLTVGTKTKKRMVDQMQQESSGAVIPPLFHCAYWATFVQRKLPDALVVVQSWQWWSQHCVPEFTELWSSYSYSLTRAHPDPTKNYNIRIMITFLLLKGITYFLNI